MCIIEILLIQRSKEPQSTTCALHTVIFPGVYILLLNRTLVIFLTAILSSCIVNSVQCIFFGASQHIYTKQITYQSCTNYTLYPELV